jgi:hypothetical protein
MDNKIQKMDEKLIEGARAIRPYLTELLGDRAEAVDAQLAELLNKSAAGGKTDNLILDVLVQDDKTRKWLDEFLDRGTPAAERSYSPLPGQPTPVMAQRYECPQGDYVWYRRTVADKTPRCPTHNVPLRSSS